MAKKNRKPVKITETILRDAHQSLIATRMTTEQMLPIIDKMEGDLTQEFHIKRKDEFSILAKGMNDMLASMRVLMTDMQKFGNEVKEMADGVSIEYSEDGI